MSSRREARSVSASAVSAAGALVVAVTPIALARALRSAVCDVSGVAGVAGGRGTEAATYGPHEKVTGVVIRSVEDAYHVEIHIVARYSETLRLSWLADAVRTAVYRTAADLDAPILTNVDIVVDDLWFDEAAGR